MNPTLWTLGYAIPYHTDPAGSTEAKHAKLAKYVENNCNIENARGGALCSAMNLFVSYCGLERLILSVFLTSKRKKMLVTPSEETYPSS